jgi:glutamate racemase
VNIIPFKIIVTDSGLGGLSVAAKIEKELREKNFPGEFEVIFYNSLPYSKFGYNLIKDVEDRVKLFDSALNGMVEHFNPNLIVLACNTLSVLFPKTKFSRKNEIPICEIIEPGIEILNKKLNTNVNSAAIILGTETTVFSNVHKNSLLKLGIEPERIINQPCNYLESEIQIEPEGAATKELIKRFTGSAITAAGKNFEKLYFALCCTHYQYSKTVFQSIISESTDLPFEIVDPNEFLVKDVIQLSNKVSTNGTKMNEVRSSVVCKFKIPQNEIEILSPLLVKESLPFANAFRNYEFKKDLFVYPIETVL